MAKSKEQKKQILAKYEEYLANAKALYLASTKLTANESNALRKKLKECGATFTVAKNTLLTIAVRNVLNENVVLNGPISIVSVDGDIVEAAKIIAQVEKEGKASYVLTVLEGKILDGSKIGELSKLESREQLLGKLVYLVNYPTTGLARALANNIEKLLYALNAVKEKK